MTLPFGTPQLSSGFPDGGKDNYAFIVAIMLFVTDNTTTPGTLHVYTAGHDPDVEIGM